PRVPGQIRSVHCVWSYETTPRSNRSACATKTLRWRGPSHVDFTSSLKGPVRVSVSLEINPLQLVVIFRAHCMH
ncbi:hypothetical protein PMAYCL1PPCAC_27513, partial [Pristionchus mayeri]